VHEGIAVQNAASLVHGGKLNKICRGRHPNAPEQAGKLRAAPRQQPRDDQQHHQGLQHEGAPSKPQLVSFLGNFGCLPALAETTRLNAGGGRASTTLGLLLARTRVKVTMIEKRGVPARLPGEFG
jgi:hypothetical protein